MAGASLELDLSEIQEGLADIIKKLSDLTPLLSNIGAVLLLSSQMRIQQTKTAPDGSAWQPLTNKYKRLRQKKGTIGNGILMVRGNLLRSLNYNAKADELTVSMGGSGKSMDYARIHQLGGEINIPPRTQNLKFDKRGWFSKPKKAVRSMDVNIGGYTIHMPARPVLGLSEQDKQDVLAEIEDYLKVE
jgi:phage virion morphogenesis protein